LVDEWTVRFTERGVRNGSVVAIDGSFSPQACAAFLAATKLGAVVVPLTPVMRAQRAQFLAIAEVSLLVELAEDDAYTLESLPRAVTNPLLLRLFERGHPGLVIFSSGSTGAPKAILHDLIAIVGKFRKLRQRKTTLTFLLFDHIGGINTLFHTLSNGGALVSVEARDPETVCAAIARHRVELLPTSPTFLNLLLLSDECTRYDLSSLELITYGTEPMPEPLLQRLRAALPHVKFIQTFGTSETGISTTTSESSQSTFFKIADANVQYRIADGELQLKSTTQFLGYLNQSGDAVTEDGWFRTGDLVEENADGFIKIKGRATEVINVGGEKVLPLELESVLLGSPLVADCVVYGVPNAITGQSVCVDVMPRGDLTRAQLRRHIVEFLTGKVDRFKIPTKVNLVDAVAVSERFKKRRVKS